MMRRRYIAIKQDHSEELIRICRAKPEFRASLISDIAYWIKEVNRGNDLFFRPRIQNNFIELREQVNGIESAAENLLRNLIGNPTSIRSPMLFSYLRSYGHFDCNIEVKNLLLLQKACMMTKKHFDKRIKPGRPISRDKDVIVNQISYLISAIEKNGGKASVNNPEISDGGTLTTVLNRLKMWGYLKNRRLANVTYSHTKEARSRVNREKKARQKVSVASVALKART